MNESSALAQTGFEHQLYASEDILQQFFAPHLEVLAGDQIDPAAPPRWLLIRREATIRDSAGGTDRWWLDHLGASLRVRRSSQDWAERKSQTASDFPARDLLRETHADMGDLA